MFIMINDQVTVEDLLKGIIIASGNDACVALAEGIAGSEENFAEMMNEKASEIGMTSTNFTNSSGINDPENISTVRDIALMSKYLIENYPKYYELFKEKTFTWDRTGGDPIKQGNRNPLLYKNKGADGIKTGYLAVEKYSLASSMKKNDRRLIAVASGFNTKNLRSSESLKLLNWGFRNTNTFEVSKKNLTTFELDTWLGKNSKVKAVSKEDYYITISKKNIRNLNVFLKYDGPIVAPIRKNDKIAELVVSNKGEVLKSLPLYAAEDIKKVNFFKSLITSINYLIWGDVQKPFFIVFEGVEGSGKSYQCKKLFYNLKKEKINYINYREPGGTKSAELIRNLILKDYFQKSKKEKFDKYTDTLLYLAARNEHVVNRLQPALKKVVICDRFIDSTMHISPRKK